MNTEPPISPSDYIRVDSLPAEQREAFVAWIFHQTRPVVPTELDEEGRSACCAYRWDYEHWLAAWRRGETAEPLD